MFSQFAELDPAPIVAIITALGILAGAIASSVVVVVKALREARTSHVEAKASAETATKVAVATKASTESGQADIRDDLAHLADMIGKVDSKVTKRLDSLDSKFGSLGKDQKALFDMVVDLDKKMEQHILESQSVSGR